MNFKVLFLFAVAGLLISTSNSQSPSSTCPKGTTVKNFRPDGLNGRWFLTHKIVNHETKFHVESDAFTVFQGNCTFLYALHIKSSGSIGINITTITGKKIFQSNRFAKLNSDGTFTQKVKILTSEINLVYAGLDMDYQNFAALYACAGITGRGRVQVGWIMSRKRTIDQVSLERALKAFKDQNLLVGLKLDTVQQAGCKN